MRSDNITFFSVTNSPNLISGSAKCKNRRSWRLKGSLGIDITSRHSARHGYKLTLAVGQTRLPPYEFRWPPKYVGYQCVCVCRVLYGVRKKCIQEPKWFFFFKYKTSNRDHPNGCAYEDRRAKILHEKQNRNGTECIPNRIFIFSVLPCEVLRFSEGQHSQHVTQLLK